MGHLMYESRIKYVPMNVALSVPTPEAMDPATEAWVAEVIAQGGSVSSIQRSRVDSLIVGLKADGLFSGRIWIHAGESVSQQATIDIVTLVTASPASSPTLSASGYQGNGSNTFINYGPAPTGYTQDSATFAAYNMTSSGTPSSTAVLMGVEQGGVYADLYPLFDGFGAQARINAANTGLMAAGNANSSGFFITSRTASNACKIYRNGTHVGSTSAASTGLPSISFISLARNNDNTAEEYSSYLIGAFALMGGLDDTQAANLSSRINAYMTAWGVNTY